MNNISQEDYLTAIFRNLDDAGEIKPNLLAEKLKLSKSKTLNVHFDYLPDEDHATIGHQGISNGFRMIYKP